MQAQAYVFDQARDVIEWLQTFEGAPPDVSLLMTDRTAEKEFSLEARATSETALPLSEGGEQLARALHPLAALGAPGSGLVGVGATLEYLHGAGLGSHRDLPKTLAACSVSADDVKAAVQALLNGGVLMIDGRDHDNAASVESRARKLTLRFPESAQPVHPPIIGPAAPAAEQHAPLTPAVTPSDDVSRNLEDR
jgi:hypothetical protein